MALSAAFVPGCGDDSAGTSQDATPDQTSPTPDGSGKEASVADATGGDSTTQDGSSSDTSTSSEGGDATMTSDASDAARDVTTVTDAADASDASDARSSGDGASGGDASDASEASAVDANEAGGVCSTTLASLGVTGLDDAGHDDGGVTPTILFDFDVAGSGADAGVPAGFQAFMDTNSTDTLGITSTDGSPCFGAISLTATYTAYGPHDQLYYQWATPQDWTGYTSLHFRLKVITTSYATIQGVEPEIQSSGFALKYFSSFTSGTTLSDGGWHEVVIPLVPAIPDSGTTGYNPATVNALQIELQSVGTQPAGAPATPPQATMLVDSIWVE